MKLSPTSLIRFDDSVAAECAKYDTANKTFILIFRLDEKNQNNLVLVPRPDDDPDYYGYWLNQFIPTNQTGHFLKTYTHESFYESDDCFFAVHSTPAGA
ncbi:hypothetical protein EV174_006224, partial [Coemansia sp. RSA 2320]